MGGGLYRSTPHRVRNPAPRDRLSLTFFFDARSFASVRPIELAAPAVPRDGRDERRDRASVHAFEGTYGDHLPNEVGKVSPGCARRCSGRPERVASGSLPRAGRDPRGDEGSSGPGPSGPQDRRGIGVRE